MPKQLSRSTRNAIRKFGLDACQEAYRMHQSGYGASGVANEGPMPIKTTREADAAINAGRELAQAEEVEQ